MFHNQACLDLQDGQFYIGLPNVSLTDPHCFSNRISVYFHFHVPGECAISLLMVIDDFLGAVIYYCELLLLCMLASCSYAPYLNVNGLSLNHIHNYFDRFGVCFCNSLTTLEIVLLIFIDIIVEQPSSTTSYWDSSCRKGHRLFDCYR